MKLYSQDTGRVQPEAFAPHKERDVTGLSVSRAKYKSIEEAARGQPGKAYFVAVLPAGELRQAGITIEPRPRHGDPGHAELPKFERGESKRTRHPGVSTCAGRLDTSRRRSISRFGESFVAKDNRCLDRSAERSSQARG